MKHIPSQHVFADVMAEIFNVKCKVSHVDDGATQNAQLSVQFNVTAQHFRFRLFLRVNNGICWEAALQTEVAKVHTLFTHVEVLI